MQLGVLVWQNGVLVEKAVWGGDLSGVPAFYVNKAAKDPSITYKILSDTDAEFVDAVLGSNV